MIEKRILTSNFTIKEQNSFIEKDIKKTFFINDTFSFLNKNLEGIRNNKLGIYKETNIVYEKINFPLIILSTDFLKEIFLLLQENSLNRLFFIEIKNENILIIKDILFNKEIEVKNKVFFKKENTFSLNSSIFYFFKLNKKTINKKSLLYIFDNNIIYENIRSKEPFFYTINTGE